MTGQQLKNSILQEAIQGRLVPNVLESGEKTGAELLQDILTERQKKEHEEKGKKARKLTLSIIEDEPWELPEGWCWALISDVFDHSAGKSLNSSKISNGKVYPYLTTSNVYWEGINFEKVKEMAFTEEEYKKCSAIKNDILVCEGGDVGRSCIWTYDYSIGLQNHVHRLRPIKNTEVKFFNYVLRFYKATGIITAKGIGIGGFSANALKGLAIPVPPLSIQKAIVAKIEELFPIVDEYDKANIELDVLNKSLPDKLRKSVLQEAIHGTLVPNVIPDGEATASELLQQILKERQDREDKEKGKKAKKLTLSTIEEEPWELPEGWCWAQIGDICSKIVDGDHNPPQGEVVTTNYLMLSSKNINNNTLLELDSCRYLSKANYEIANSRTAAQKGDILLTTVATLGRSCIFDGSINAVFQRSVTVITTLIFNKYLKVYLDSPLCQNTINDKATGTAQRGFYLNQFSNLIVPLPPLSIQHRIVEKIEEVFSAINNL